MKKISILILSLCFASQAFAACDPKDDPCAPKKVIGEWVSSAALGYNLSSGNADTSLLSIMAATQKEVADEIYNFGAQYNFGSDKDRNDPVNDDTTRNDFRANAAYKRLLSDKLFAGFGTSFLYDEIADIDYRSIVNPSLGYYVLKDEDYKLNFEAGPSYVFEKQGGESNDYLAPRIADRFDWIISCTSKIYQQTEVLLDVDNSDNYLVNTEVGIESALSTSLSLVVLARNNYDNVPAVGREKSDTAFITAVKVAL